MIDFKSAYREKLETRKSELQHGIQELHKQRQEALQHLDQVNSAILQATGRLGEVDSQILELNASVVEDPKKPFGDDGKV